MITERAAIKYLEQLRIDMKVAAQLHSTMDRSYDYPDCGHRVSPLPTLDQQERRMH